MSLTTAELNALVRELAADRDSWEHLVSHDPEQRTFVLLQEDEQATVWLLCWSDGHDTGFHDHDTSGAAITVLSGNVREERLRVGGDPVSKLLEPGEVVEVPPSAIHRVRHAGAGPAVSIHAYSPPLRRTGTYEVGPNGELLRTARDGREELRDELAVA